MENYSYAELTEFYFLAQSAMDTQFQYWITITFAAVVAGFVAGERLRLRLRYVVAALYVLASVVLVVRFLAAAFTMSNIQSFLQAADAFVIEPFNIYLAPLRIPMFLIGTAAALYFLLRPQAKGSNRSDAG